MKMPCLIGIFFLVGLSLSCNRFEAKHEQIPADTREDVQDKTQVIRDTTSLLRPDTNYSERQD